MTNAQMERELARATGESLAKIRRRGFQLVEPPELEPFMIDWDAIYPANLLGGFSRRPGGSGSPPEMAALLAIELCRFMPCWRCNCLPDVRPTKPLPDAPF